MKDKTGGVMIEEFVALKPKLNSFLVENSEHKEGKGVNKNILATIRHNKYKDVLLNKECIRHSIEFKVKPKNRNISNQKHFIVLI